MRYRGYDIAESNDRGGKAGRGCNRTATVQVREATGSGYLLLKQFLYTVGDSVSKAKAVEKSKAFIDALKNKTQRIHKLPGRADRGSALCANCDDCACGGKELTDKGEWETDWYGVLHYYKCRCCGHTLVSQDGGKLEIAAINL